MQIFFENFIAWEFVLIASMVMILPGLWDTFEDPDLRRGVIFIIVIGCQINVLFFTIYFTFF